jgi:hypothetical protein
MWQGFGRSQTSSVTGPRNGEMSATLFVMVRVWLGVNDRED